MSDDRHSGNWPSDVELETLGAPDVALGVLDLAMAAPEWVHRRVERVELMTATHFRRRVSLDLTIPVGSAPVVEWFLGERLVLLPLDAIAKRPLADFDLRDEDGRPVPTLTRRQNSHVSWRALCAIARQTIGGDVPTDVEHRLRAVTQGSGDSSLGALAHLIDDPGSPVGRALIADEGFLTVADLLARNFLLVGAFAVDRPVRRILKFAYEESLSAVADRADERTKWERVQESLGLRPTTLQVRVPSFAECESYHFEATAPPGIEFIDVVLGDEYRTSEVVTEAESLAAWTLGYRRLLESSPHRAHLATSRTSNEEQGNPPSQEEFVDPQISVTVRVERGGWLLASVVSAVLIATFFLASAPYISAWDERPMSVVCEQLPSADPSQRALPSVSAADCSAAVDEALDTDPAAFTGALLGVVSLVVVRSGEHAYTARLIRGVRVVSVAVASSPLVGAWLIVFPGPGELLEWGWRVLTAASVAAAVLLVGVFRAGAR